jgi:site-specific recombinase XerD
MERETSIARFSEYLNRRSPGRRTGVAYVNDVQQFAAGCAKPWREVTVQDVDAFVDQQRAAGRSAATVKRRVAGLRVFFELLIDEAGDPSWRNPVRFKRHAGQPTKRLPRDLPDAAVDQVWGVLTSARDRAWFVLMLRGGLRVGEVVALTVADVPAPPAVGQPARLRVLGKGRKERIVLLSADAYAVLLAWVQQRPPSAGAALFLNERGEALSANGIQWLLRGYGQQIGRHLTPHQLRHTYARQLREHGMPLPTLSQLMGHAQLSTTLIYTAGVDPALCQDYPRAVAALEQAAPIPPAPPAPAAPPASPPLAAREPPEALPTPQLPETWPAGLREPCLAYLRHVILTWNPRHAAGLLARRESELRRFGEWLLARHPVTTLADLTLADLRAYQTAELARGLSPLSVNRALDPLLTLLRQHAEQGQPVAPDLERLERLARPAALPRALAECQAQALDQALRQPLDAAPVDPLARLELACVAVLLHTGLRASECLDLRRGDVDLPGLRLTVRRGKGQVDRVVYFSPRTAGALAAYGLDASTPTALLFRLPDGRPLPYAWLNQHVRAFAAAAGVPDVTPHRLRHTFATRLLNHGLEITRIQKLLGHTSLATTQLYARVYDATVETDYRQVMSQVEAQAMPWSTTPVSAPDWPMPQPIPAPLPAPSKGEVTP